MADEKELTPEEQASIRQFARNNLQDAGLAGLALHGFIEETGIHGQAGKEGSYLLYDEELNGGKYDSTLRKLMVRSRGENRYGNLQEQELQERARNIYQLSMLFSDAGELLSEIGYTGEKLSGVKGTELKDVDPENQQFILSSYLQYKANERAAQGLQKINETMGPSLDKDLIAIEKERASKQEAIEKQKANLKKIKPKDIQLSA